MTKKLGYAVLVGLVAAEVVPPTRAGLGWLLAGIVGLVAVVAAERRGTRSPARIGAAVAMVLLVGAGTVRAAGWLFALCLAVALPCASVAVAGGGTTWGRLLRNAFVLPWSVPDALRGAVAAAPRPRSGIRQLAAGTTAGVALAALFAGLFAAASPGFARLARESLPRLTFGGVVLFVVAGVLALAAMRLRTLPAEPEYERDPRFHPPRRMLARAEWIVPLALVDLVFAVFVGTEAEVFFGGTRYVLDPGGPTFAGYARDGFWELGVVTILALGIVAVVAYRVDRAAPLDRVLVRSLVGALGALTLVVVASAAYRMQTYVRAYGYTRVRLLELAGELVLGAVVVLVLAAGVRLRGRWLPGACASVVVCAVLALVAVNPDAVVARTVVGRYEHDGHLDAAYLSGLSPDAIPAVDRLPEPWRSCVLAHIDGDRSTVDSWWSANLGRATARAALRDRLIAPATLDCDYVVELANHTS